MKFFALVSALLASTAAAVPTASPATDSNLAEKRDAGGAVANSISTLQTSIITLNSSINNFNPVSLNTVGGILDLLKDADAVGTNLISATKAADASAPLSFNDTLSVVRDVLTLQPKIQSLLQNFVAHRPSFDSVALVLSVRKTVLEALQLDQKLTASFATALTAKLDKSLQSAAPFIAMQIDQFFVTAIANFNQHKAGLDLPAIPSKVEGDQVVNL